MKRKSQRTTPKRPRDKRGRFTAYKRAPKKPRSTRRPTPKPKPKPKPKPTPKRRQPPPRLPPRKRTRRVKRIVKRPRPKRTPRKPPKRKRKPPPPARFSFLIAFKYKNAESERAVDFIVDGARDEDHARELAAEYIENSEDGDLIWMEGVPFDVQIIRLGASSRDSRAHVEQR